MCTSKRGVCTNYVFVCVYVVMCVCDFAFVCMNLGPGFEHLLGKVHEFSNFN